MRGCPDVPGRLALVSAGLCVALHAQAPRLHAVFAASEHRGGVPAIAWLCEELLPSLPSWPAALDPAATFALTVSEEGVALHPTAVAVPEGEAALGAVTLSDDLDQPALLWCCGRDGDEEWRVPAGFEAQPAWRTALAALGADVIDTPRTIAAPVLAGHLSGGLLEGDPRATLLRVGPALCGDVTWTATRADGAIRVRGRSGGGLMLPLALLLSAGADGSAAPTALQLRAFAARDGDRGEAARQLGREDRELDVDTLRALLHGGDELRLAAIRSLTQQGATDALPQILDAAVPGMPWSVVAARDALDALWPSLDGDQRAAARAALRRNRCPQLRGVDLRALDAPRSVAVERLPDDSGRARVFVVLVCSGVGLLGLWRRERLRAPSGRRPAIS